MFLKKSLAILFLSSLLFGADTNTTINTNIDTNQTTSNKALQKQEEKSYSACANTLKAAKIELSGLISSAVSTENTQIQKSERSEGKEKASSKIESKNKISSNLKLFNITTFKKGKEVCVKVFHKDQVEKTKILLKKLLALSIKDLPVDLNERTKTIKSHLDDLKQFEGLSTVFMTQMKDKDQQKLYALKKELTDEYTKTISKINTLIFKVCKQNATNKQLLSALNNKIFIKEKKSVKEEATSLFSKFKAILNSKKETQPQLLLNSVDSLVHYKNEDEKKCIFIEKKALLKATQKRFDEIKLYKKEFLKKDPQAALKQIDSWLKQLDITKEFMKVYPNLFKSAKFKVITDTKKELEKLKTTINPQSVTFSVEDAEGTKIKLDNKVVKENTPYNIKAGLHNYKATAKGKCPLKDNFNLDKNEKKEITLDFSDRNYATLYVQSNQPATLIINGDVIPVNKKVSLHNCADNVPYTIKFLDQSFKGKFDLRPNEKVYKEFNFLSNKEMAIFQDVKTKNFTVTSKQKFSDALAPIQSKRLIYTLEDKPHHGDIELSEKGTFVYVSTDDFIGVDNFTYKIKTENDESATKAVHLTIQADKFLIAAQKKKAAEAKRKKDLEAKKRAEEEKKAAALKKKEALAKKQKAIADKKTPIQKEAPKELTPIKKTVPIQPQQAQKEESTINEQVQAVQTEVAESKKSVVEKVHQVKEKVQAVQTETKAVKEKVQVKVAETKKTIAKKTAPVKEKVQEKVQAVQTEAKAVKKKVQEKVSQEPKSSSESSTSDASQESDDEGVDPAILKAFIIKKVRDGHPELLHKIAAKYPKTFKKVIHEVKEELRHSRE